MQRAKKTSSASENQAGRWPPRRPLAKNRGRRPAREPPAPGSRRRCRPPARPSDARARPTSSSAGQTVAVRERAPGEPNANQRAGHRHVDGEEMDRHQQDRAGQQHRLRTCWMTMDGRGRARDYSPREIFLLMRGLAALLRPTSFGRSLRAIPRPVRRPATAALRSASGSVSTCRQRGLQNGSRGLADSSNRFSAGGATHDGHADRWKMGIRRSTLVQSLLEVGLLSLVLGELDRLLPSPPLPSPDLDSPALLSAWAAFL